MEDKQFQEQVIQGFAEMRQQSTKIDQRFTKIDQKFLEVKQQLVDNKFSFATIHQQFFDVNHQLDRIIDKLVEHDDRLDGLDKKIDDQISDLKNEVMLGNDKVIKVVLKMETELAAHTHTNQRQDAQLTEHAMWIGKLKVASGAA